MKNAWYLAIFLIPLVMNPWGMQLYGSGKIFWFFGMVGLFLVGVFFSRWADLRRFALKFHRGIYLYLGLWVVSFLLSTVFSLAPVRSFFGEYSLMQGSLFYIFLAAHFLICLALFSDKNLQRLFFWLVKWIGAVAAIAAILLWTAPEYSNRLFGASGQPNFLAQFLIFPLFIVLFDVFGKSGRMKKKVRGRIADFVVMVLLAAVIFLTGSRAVEIGIGFSLWLMFVLIWNGKAIYKLLITVGLIVVVIAGLWNFGLEMRSLNLRFFLWKGAAQSLNSENIWMGSGVETFYRQFAAVMPKEVFENEQFYRVPESPHNEFLEALTERGIFGAALYLIPLGFLLMLVWKKEDRRKFLGIKTLEVYLALVAYYVAVQFSFSVMEHWVYLAAFWAVLLLKVVKFRNFEIGKVRIVALPVGVFAIIFAVFYLRMDILLARGMSVFIEDDAAYGYFDDAASSMPILSYPQKILINLYAGEKNTDEYLARYGKIDGHDFNYHVLGMNVDSMDRFDGHYLEAVRMAPNLPIVYTEAGDRYFVEMDCERAVEQYEILEELAPSAYGKGGREQRLFEKHAGLFVKAMERKGECEKSNL